MIPVKDMSVEQRQAIESLLGRRVGDEENIAIFSWAVEKEAPKGAERVQAAEQLNRHLDKLAERVKDVPEAELDALVDEAIEWARRSNG